MRSTTYGVLALIAATLAGPAYANVCVTERFTCTTTMPEGGYCECTSRGMVQDGTVSARAPDRRSNATAGGCGAHPNAPGCRGDMAPR